MEFAPSEGEPGSSTKLNLRAGRGSLCAIGVVDESVHLLGGDNQVKKDKVL